MDDVEIPQHAVGGHCPLKVYLGAERTYSGLLEKLPYGCFAAGLAAYGAASAALPPAAAGFLRNTLGEKYLTQAVHRHYLHHDVVLTVRYRRPALDLPAELPTICGV